MIKNISQSFFSFLYKKKILITALLGIFLFPTRLIFASIFSDIGNGIYYLPAYLFYAIAYTTNTLANLIIQLFTWVIKAGSIMSYTNPGGPNGNPIIKAGFDVTLSFVNIILVMALIFIALTTILRLKEYETKKLLTRFIIIALIVNFSPVICGLAVDASNIVTNSFLDRVGGAGKNATIADDIWYSPYAYCGYGMKEDQNDPTHIWGTTATDDGPGIGTVCADCIMQSVVYVILFFIYLLFALLFLLRIFAIWILVILSPIAFACAVLPATKKFWDEWLNNFTSWCMIGITGGFFVWLGGYMASNAGKMSANMPTGVLGSWLLPFIIPVIFLIIGFSYSLKTGLSGASMVSGFVGGLATGFLGGAIATAKYPIKKAASAVGRRVQEGAEFRGTRYGLREGANWLAKTAEGSRITRWAVPDALRKYGQSRTGVEAAQKELGAYGSPDLMRRVMSGDLYGEKASAAVLETIKRGDSQEIIKSFRSKYKIPKSTTDEQIIKDERFRNIMKRPLDIAKRSGLSSSALLRNDPRLARLNTLIEPPLTDPKDIADRENEILSFAKTKGVATPSTKIKDLSSDQIENLKQEMAVRDTVKDLKPANIQNFEKETLEDEEMMTYMLGHGRDHFSTMGSGVKRGVETGQQTINKIFTEWAKKNGRNTKSPATAADQANFKKYISEQTGGRTGFFDSLSDPRMKSQGWTDPAFIP